MSQWVDVGPITELKFDPGAPVLVDGKWLAVFRRDEHDVTAGYHVIDNVCPHASAPLCDGTVIDGKVACYLHLWEFDLATGACEVGEQWNVQTYRSRVVGERLEIELP